MNHVLVSAPGVPCMVTGTTDAETGTGHNASTVVMAMPSMNARKRRSPPDPAFIAKVPNIGLATTNAESTCTRRKSLKWQIETVCSYGRPENRSIHIGPKARVVTTLRLRANLYKIYNHNLAPKEQQPHCQYNVKR